MQSLLGHIVLRFTSQSENLATESLEYILSNSHDARLGLIKFIGRIDNRLTGELHFKTQVHDDDRSIPDLVGSDDDNDQICIIESKFEAGLTDNQPVTYIKRFKSEKPSILLFLVPAKRMESLWSELISRCQDERIGIIEEIREPNMISGKLNENHHITVVDWNSLLSLMKTELEAAGDYIFKSDLLQLIGLCNQMDEETFLPLDSQEISPMIARRNMQFYDIIEQVFKTGIARGFYSSKGLKSGSGLYYYGRYFKMKEYFYFLAFENQNWYRIRNSPLWLTVYGKGWLKDTAERTKVKKALFKLEFEDRLFFDENNLSLIPIKLELGVDKNKVIESIIEQINEITNLLDSYYLTLD